MTCAVDLFIGERIIAFRKKRNLSQDVLAGMLNISRQQLQKYETGIAKVPMTTIAEISNLLDIKVLDLLGGIDDVKSRKRPDAEYITEQRTAPLNILLIEDNTADELLTRKAIDQSGYVCNIVSFNNGVESLEYLRKCFIKGIHPQPAPDIILLDLNIPRMRGEEVLKSIKSNNSFHHLPVIVVTNSIHREEMIRMYKLGASGFIVKSFDPDDFFVRIATIISYWHSMALPSM